MQAEGRAALVETNARFRGISAGVEQFAYVLAKIDAVIRYQERTRLAQAPLVE